MLVARDWIVHVVSEHFPDDAQKTSDPEWISYGLARGWSLLTQDLLDRRVGFFVIHETGAPRRKR
jgi:hypothetical protein